MTRPGRAGWPKTGRAFKKSPSRARPPRADRRKRLLFEPAGAAHLGAERQNARATHVRPPPRQGLGRGSALSVAPGRRRTGLYFHADAKHYIAAQTIVAFLREVL